VAHANEPVMSISEQAAHWWMVFNDTEASPTERREFGEWTTRGPERVEAYLRLARLRATLSRADVRWPATSAEELIRASLASRKEPIPLRREERRHPAARLVLGLAASLLLAACMGWYLWMRPEHYETKFGEQRSVVLADGSRVTLNTASDIEVRLRSDHRSIKLVKGEALFEVAHDSKRPFDVTSGNAVLRAVGTQFTVDRRADRTVVTVVEGRVAMFTGEKNPVQEPHTPVLGVADRAVIGANGMVVTEHRVNLTAATAWLRRKLVFQRRTLGEAAEEFNRYNRERVEIRSPELRAERFSATFDANDVASFATFLASTPGVRVSRDATGGYVVDFDGIAK